MKHIDKLTLAARKAFAPGFMVKLTYSDGAVKAMDGHAAILAILDELETGRGDPYIVSTDQPLGSFISALLGDGMPAEGLFDDDAEPEDEPDDEIEGG